MRILLAWFADFAWVLYAACGLGAVIYVARALSLQRRLGASLTSFERETSTIQIVRFLRLAVFFVVVGVAFFAAQAYLLPQIPPDDLVSPAPTLVGLTLPTPPPAPTATPLSGSLPTITATVPPPPLPATPTLEVTDTPEPISTSEPVPSIALGIRLGNVAELVGYDLVATEVNTSQGVGLILYWRALAGATVADYSVFTHLRSPDARLIAQHDGPPVGGTRPTTSWVVGELVVDYHQLVFGEEEAGYAGPAEIAVGLYDPTAPEVRVPVEGGGDFVTLPSSINVVGP